MKDIIKYREYIGSIHYSMEDEVFYGKVQGIEDLVSFEGSTVNEIKESFQEAVDDYLELCREAGKKPEKSYKGTFNVRVSPDLHKKAARRSMETGISLNKLVEEALRDKLTS